MADLPPRGQSPLEIMQQEMERLLDHVLRYKRPPAFLSTRTWQPSVDVCESQESVHILVELAGVKREDLDLTITQETLTIRGERVGRHQGQQIACYQLEIPYGSFERAVQLPPGLDTGHITAATRDGLLEITIPKRHPDILRVPIQTV